MSIMNGCEMFLDGYRALDLTGGEGVSCGAILSYLGAEVIRIDKPEAKDTEDCSSERLNSPGLSPKWLAYNTGKKSLTLNIETIQGQDIFRRLAKTADFIIESFPPLYMAKLGLDYASIKDINSRVIMASITPFGQSGPYHEYKSSDLVATALGGLMYIVGDVDRAPLRLPGEQSYFQAGLHGAAAILTAIYYRQRSGLGQYIDISIHECVFRTAYTLLPEWEFAGVVPRRTGSQVYRYGTRLREVWRCHDGHVTWRPVSGKSGENEWQVLLEWMRSESMSGSLNQEDFSLMVTGKMSQEQADAWGNSIAKFFASHTKDEIQQGALERGIRILSLSNCEDLLKNEQLQAREYWAMADISNYKESSCMPYPAYLFLSTEDTRRAEVHAASLGEHNREIYEKELKFSQYQLNDLSKKGVI
ncbi:MAG: CoA transferase [Dehalococcoidales bacterium]|nr:CoA transferase [Dehalococcoidales bacterium]